MLWFGKKKTKDGAAPASDTPTDAQPQEKKGLLSGLFGKKDKGEAAPAPAEPEPEPQPEPETRPEPEAAAPVETAPPAIAEAADPAPAAPVEAEPAPEPAAAAAPEPEPQPEPESGPEPLAGIEDAVEAVLPGIAAPEPSADTSPAPALAVPEDDAPIGVVPAPEPDAITAAPQSGGQDIAEPEPEPAAETRDVKHPEPDADNPEAAPIEADHSHAAIRSDKPAEEKQEPEQIQDVAPVAPVVNVKVSPPSPPPTEHAPQADTQPEPDLHPEHDPIAEMKKPGFFARMTQGLRRSSSKLAEGITSVFTRKKLDDETLEELEDLLISSDLGARVAVQVCETIRKDRFDKEVTDEEIKGALATEITKVLEKREEILDLSEGPSPRVVLFVGVNGSGKTTTIGKIAAKLSAQGADILCAAGDTFRAAAVEQLKVWSERAGCAFLSRPQGADSAGLAFDAVKQARSENRDLVLIDTAGRLQNRAELMEELAKVVRAIRKVDETAPHDVILVLDATVGQNALSQVDAFRHTAGVTGLVMTKLDGTAKGGVLVAIADKYDIPIHFVGVGEKAEDLHPFSARAFANALVGLTDDVTG